MGYITGHDGMVNGAQAVRVIRISPKSPGGPYAGSNSGGAIDRIDGWKDWEAMYEAYGHTPASMPGDSLNFVGSIDGSVGVYGTSIVESFVLDIEIPQEEEQPPSPISHSVVVKGNGPLNRGAAVAVDTSVPNPPNPKDLKIQYAQPSGSPTWTTVCSAYRSRLVIAKRNPLYRPGCNSGATFRLPGNVDVQLEFDVYESSMTSLPTEGANYSVRVYVSGTEFWEINYMKLEAIEPFEIPIETRKLVWARLRWSFKSTAVINGTATRGSIKKPDTTVWWP